MKNNYFPLGTILLSRSVGDLVAIDTPFTKFIIFSLNRHKSLDWGDCGEEDTDNNNLALSNGSRLFSVYNIPKPLLISELKIWIITEADRKSTTVLFPSEY
ncbi:MAG: hypothetical protein ABI851_16360 [Saprospiraceae bacterium]